MYLILQIVDANELGKLLHMIHLSYSARFVFVSYYPQFDAADVYVPTYQVKRFCPHGPFCSLAT